MTTAATFTSTDHQRPHHGQPSGVQLIGDMDNPAKNPGNAGLHSESDVMNTSVNTTAPPSDVKTLSGGVVSEARTVSLSQNSSLPSGRANEAEILTPLRLRQKEHALQQPHPSQDLLTLYGLSSLAASVARTDPITGEKINKMRRSYEGQVKAFGLAGRNKAVKLEDNTPGGLVDLVNWPDEEWQIQKVSGKELERGLSVTMLAKLEKAMKMEPGPVPKNDEWENILGLEKLKPPIPLPEQKGKAAAPGSAKPQKMNGVINLTTPGTPAANEAARPKRTGKKRRYDELSFEGYGEGFVDDDGAIMDAGGYTSEEGSRKSGASKKKRKKDYPGITPTGVPERAGSYGVGMIHVPVGAYGR